MNFKLFFCSAHTEKAGWQRTQFVRSILNEHTLYKVFSVKQRATLSRLGVETASNSFHLSM